MSWIDLETNIIESQIHQKSIGTYVGLLGAAPYAGASFSSAFITYVSDRLGWRHSMTPIFVICSVVSLFVVFIVPSETEQTKKHINASSVDSEKKNTSSIIGLFKINGVSAIASAVFFLKFVR